MTEIEYGKWLSFFLLLVLMPTIGCNNTLEKKTISNEERIILEKECGITLPKDVEMLMSGDMDTRGKLYTWVFYSKSGFTLSPDQFSAPCSYLPEGNVKLTAECIQCRIPAHKLPAGTHATTLFWDSNTYQYKYHLLKTSDGDYLWVERFVKH